MKKKIKIHYSRRAVKFLEKVPIDIRKRILEHVAMLSENPFPKGCIKLRGIENVYRLRVGDYRVLYELLPGKDVILIVKIDHRRRVYKNKLGNSLSNENY